MRGKRFLSLFLALAMILSLVPATALAAGDDGTLTGTVAFNVYEVNSANDESKPLANVPIQLKANRQIVGIGTTDLNGTATVTVSYDKTNKTLAVLNEKGVATGATVTLNAQTTFDCDPDNTDASYNYAGKVRLLTNANNVVAEDKSDPQFQYGYQNAKLSGNWAAEGFSFTFNLYFAGTRCDVTLKNDGQADQVYSVFSGAKLPAPVAPTKDNYTFDGWFAEGATSAFDFANTPIISNMTLTAKWTANTVPVTFISDGKTVSTQNITPGSYAADPGTTKIGYTLEGWFAENATSAFDFVNTPITSSMTLTAQWTANQYTVKFDKNAEDATGTMADLPATYDSELALTANAFSRTGYTFGGWMTSADADSVAYTDGATVKNLTAKNDETVTLYAKWTQNDKVTVTYMYMSDGSVYTTQDVIKGQKTTAPADPTKTGYTFGGWYNGETAYNFESAVSADITLTAKWTPNTYTIKFADAGKIADIPATYDVDAELPAAPTREGAVFAGWKLDENTTYEAGATVKNLTATDKGEVTLTAQWNTQPTGTISFKVYDEDTKAPVAGLKMDLNATTNSTRTEDVASAVTDENGVATISRSALANYSLVAGTTFDCDPAADSNYIWNPASVAAGTVRDIDFTSAKGVTDGNVNTANKETLNDTAKLTEEGLAGHFEFTFVCNVKNNVEKHTVTFINGEDQTTVQVADGEKVAEPTAPTKDGYKFLGWFADGATAAYDFNKVVESDLTLTAQWLKIHTVTFNSDGGTPAPEAQPVEDGKSATTPTAPTKEGYTFKGWFLGDAENAYDFTTPITGDITLKAKWEINKYTVSFVNEGISVKEVEDVEHGATLQNSDVPAAPTKAGHTFLGWFAEGATTAYNFNTPVTSDTILTAKWQANTLTVTFNTDGGSAVAAKTVAYGGTITAPTAPTKEGYTFKHWVEEDGTIFDFTETITANITLKAVWQENTAEVTTFKVQYSDGVPGKIIFPTQEYTVEAGKATPAFVGTPTREGYTFKGWSPAVAATVTADVNYKAQWEETPVATFAVNIDKATGGSVTSSVTSAEKAALVYLTVKADAGYELTSLKVLDKDNKAVKLNKGSSNNLYWFVMPESAVTVKAVFTETACNGGVNCPAFLFSDVNTKLWYHAAVDYVLTEELFKGVSATQFAPNGTMTRAMIWTVLARMDDANLAVTTPWYKSAQNWAVNNQVSDGTMPDGSVTREQLVTMLWRFMDEPQANGSLAGFSDAGKVSSWAKEAMTWAVANGVVNGVGNANGTVTLDPGATANRAQVAQMLMNFLNK